MRPLFPLPNREDLVLDEWGYGGQEQVLDGAPLGGPHKDAKRLWQKTLVEPLSLRVAPLPPEYLEFCKAYYELQIRAHLSCQLQRYGKYGTAPRGHGPDQFIQRYILDKIDHRQHPALAEWLSLLIHDAPRAHEMLSEFTPARYVESMCALFGVTHPYSHEGRAGDALAVANGFLARPTRPASRVSRGTHPPTTEAGT